MNDTWARTMSVLDQIDAACLQQIQDAEAASVVGIITDTGEFVALRHAVEAMEQLLRDRPSVAYALEHHAVRIADALGLNLETP